MDQTSQRNFYLVLFCVGIFPFLINGWINAVIFRNPYLYWSFEVLSWVVLPILVFSVAIRKGGLRFTDIGLHGELLGRRNVILVVLACLALGPIELFVYRHLVEFFRSTFPGDPLFQYQAIVPKDGILRVVVAMYLGLTAGIVEEMYFRGFFSKISMYFTRPSTFYLAFSPLLFAAIHWEGAVYNVMATYVFGLFLAVAFLALRNLWPLIVGHIYTDYMWFG